MPGERLDRIGRAAEDLVLVALLTSMIVLAVTQIVLRNFFDSGLGWADELLRIGVLWIALAGAVAASRADRQISIDVLSRWLGPESKRWVDAVVDLFTAAVCGVLAWYSFTFVRESRLFEDTLLNGLPAWWFQAILPIGFGLMCWRYLVLTLRGLAGRRQTSG
ncbi:MAG: TRAP transporter small permease [Pseudomonadota bacterium]